LKKNFLKIILFEVNFQVSCLALIYLSLLPVLLAGFGEQNVSKSHKIGEERERGRGERERERKKERETHTERHRNTETQRQTDRQRDRETETERDTHGGERERE
jgi:hypothetical protein